MGQAAALVHRRVDGPLGHRGCEVRPTAELSLIYRVLDCHPDPVAVTAAIDGQPPRIIYANAAFLQLDPAGPQTSLPTDGQCAPPGSGGPDPTGEALAPAGHPLIESLMESHRQQGLYSAEVACDSPEGGRQVLQLRSQPVAADSQTPPHRIAFFRDVTTEKKLEDALHRSERLACIGLLGAGIAHEINNPAGSALLAAETALALKDVPDAGEQIAACLRNVITSMDRCGRIVRTLLRYSRQEPTERQACSLNDVVEQSVQLARPYAESRGVQLRMELALDVPLTSMNPLEIELVLINLIRNAVEAGQEKPIVTIHTATEDTYVRAVVSDNGCGMDQEQLTHVFDPLYTTRRHVGGSGLGMSIALGIIQAHAGRIEVRSRPGAGTTISVELPTTR